MTVLAVKCSMWLNLGKQKTHIAVDLVLLTATTGLRFVTDGNV